MKLVENIKVNLSWLLSSLIILFYTLYSLNSLVLPLLRTGYSNGQGVSELSAVLFGLFFLFIIPAAALGLCIYLKTYYEKANKKNNLLAKFIFVLGAEVLYIPLFIIINNLILKLDMIYLDWVIIITTVVIAGILVIVSKQLKKS
ncbi:MAG: hypothetical protein ACOC1O_02385 [bacterium]